MAHNLPIRPDSGDEVLRTHPANPNPELNEVTVRRYVTELESSLQAGMQWIVFEPNGDALWARVRTTITDFLTKEWQSGKLIGTTAAEAFFVRCDRTTMTQNDLDNGRLNIVIGVAPVKPAEFVIINIGQWTADYKPKP